MDNVPTPLLGAEAPLFTDREWQMSFTERAVLEGIVSQLRPQIAVEIGSASGGSLRCIARHSRSVHSIDVTPPTQEMRDRPNVHPHTGDSGRLLPELLADLRCHIDFALVDGDHSTEGVRTDLMALLASRWCQHTVILLHDAAHPETRQGILSVLAETVGLAYKDVDFLPGYRFTRGGFQGQPWGGFALVITGAAGKPQIQDLYRPI